MRISDWSSDVCSSDLTLQVEVVALDWKWLFIYPQYGVATVNELAAPIDTSIKFHITASSVMNSFFIPALDRTSVVKGKSVSVRVDLGGRRIIKKKNKYRIKIKSVSRTKEHKIR